MRIIFFSSSKSHEQALARSFSLGAVAVDEMNLCVDGVSENARGYDLACMVGVKNGYRSKELEQIGVPFLFFDKGYNRRWNVSNPEWWRVAINHHQPTDYLHKLQFDGVRAAAQGWRSKAWRRDGRHILIAGASAKYHQLYGLPDPTTWASGVVERLRQFTDREIIYRPKPSWKDAVPVEGAEFKGRASHNIVDDLKNAHAMVTHGSGACLEALLSGVPAIVLGPGITSSISSKKLDEIENPRLADRSNCDQLLANLAHCQWSLDEIKQGLMRPSLNETLKTANAL